MLKFVMSVDGNNRNIPENEIRVKGFLILEVKDNPNVWGRKGSGVPGRLAGMRSLSEDWKAILLNMREAFKNDPELLAKYKVDTVSGLKNTWENLFEAHRRKWANKIEKNDSTGKLQASCLYSEACKVFGFKVNFGRSLSQSASTKL